MKWSSSIAMSAALVLPKLRASPIERAKLCPACEPDLTTIDISDGFVLNGVTCKRKLAPTTVVLVVLAGQTLGFSQSHSNHNSSFVMHQSGASIFRIAKPEVDLGKLHRLRRALLELLVERRCSQVHEEPIITKNKCRLQVTFQGRNIGESHDGT